MLDNAEKVNVRYRSTKLAVSGDGDGAVTVHEHAPLRRAKRTSQSDHMEAGRARWPLPGPHWDLRQSPRSVRNRLVYSSGVVLEIELQVGEA